MNSNLPGNKQFCLQGKLAKRDKICKTLDRVSRSFNYITRYITVLCNRAQKYVFLFKFIFTFPFNNIQVYCMKSTGSPENNIAKILAFYSNHYVTDHS
jgi:hypothetical protein